MLQGYDEMPELLSSLIEKRLEDIPDRNPMEEEKDELLQEETND